MTELTDEQINKRIHEIMELCQHEWDEWLGDYEYPSRSARCVKCHREFDELLSGDFVSSWEGFGLLWTWLQKAENGDTWKDFWSVQYDRRGRDEPESWVLKFISPPILSRSVVEFFEETHD